MNYLDPDWQRAVGMQRYRGLQASADVSPSARRPGAELSANPPVVHLYGQPAETAGQLAWGGPRNWMRRYTGTLTNPTLYDEQLYDVNTLFYLSELDGDHPSGNNLQIYYPSQRAGFVGSSYYTGSHKRVIQRYRYLLAATYDLIVMLSEGPMEEWGSTIEVYIGQPQNESMPVVGSLTLEKKTRVLTDPATGNAVARVWYEPPAGAAGDPVAAAMRGRLRIVPYLEGSSANPRTWSLAWHHLRLDRRTINSTGQINPATVAGYYRAAWLPSCRLKGLSYAHVIFANHPYGAWIDQGTTIDKPVQPRTVGAYNAFVGQPAIRFQSLKGKKFTWPGQAAATWTQNAAAIRYDVERKIRGISDSLIDTASVQAAYSTCDTSVQLQYKASPHSNVSASIGGRFDRYTIDGAIAATANLRRLIDQLDFCWQGRALLVNGKLRFTPGALGTVRATLTEDDIEDIGQAVLTPSLSERINTLAGGLIRQDHFRQGTPQALPQIVSTALRQKDGRDLVRQVGELDFTNNFFGGLYLTQIAAQLDFWRERYTLFLTPQAATTLYNLKPYDLLRWNVKASLDSPIDLWQYKQSGDSYAKLQVLKVGLDDQGLPIRVEVRPLRGDPYSPSLRMAVDPGQAETLTPDPDGRYGFAVGPPISPTASATLAQAKDGTWVDGVRVDWTNRWGATDTEVKLFSEGPDADTDTDDVEYIWSAGTGAGSLARQNIPEDTYQVSVRHQFPPQAGSTLPQYSDWLEVAAALSIGEDTTAPAAPTNVVATPVPGGVEVRWDYPDESDYSYTRVYFLGDLPNPIQDEEETKSAAIIIYTARTGSQTLHVEHFDRSGNKSAFTAVVVVLTKATAGDEVQRIFRRRNQNTAYATPTSTNQQRAQNDYVPTDWSGDPLQPTRAEQWVFFSERRRGPKETLWSEWSAVELYAALPAGTGQRLYLTTANPNYAQPKRPADAIAGDVIFNRSTGKLFEWTSSNVLERFAFFKPTNAGSAGQLLEKTSSGYRWADSPWPPAGYSPGEFVRRNVRADNPGFEWVSFKASDSAALNTAQGTGNTGASEVNSLDKTGSGGGDTTGTRTLTTDSGGAANTNEKAAYNTGASEINSLDKTGSGGGDTTGTRKLTTDSGGAANTNSHSVGSVSISVSGTTGSTGGKTGSYTSTTGSDGSATLSGGSGTTGTRSTVNTSTQINAGGAGNHLHTVPSHSHSIPSHTHSLGNHSHSYTHFHSINGHTHSFSGSGSDSLGSHFHSIDGHTHAIVAHSHTQPTHTHGLSSEHTHSIGSHFHSIDGHTHAIVAHSHTQPTHTHGLSSEHTHPIGTHVHAYKQKLYSWAA